LVVEPSPSISHPSAFKALITTTRFVLLHNILFLNGVLRFSRVFGGVLVLYFDNSRVIFILCSRTLRSIIVLYLWLFIFYEEILSLAYVWVGLIFGRGRLYCYLKRLVAIFVRALLFWLNVLRRFAFG
jgi:hypothetical protein